MKLTVTASNGAQLLVWREGDAYFAGLADEASEPQICLAVDLFEVIAELAGLDLERPDHAAEALALAQDAQRRLRLRDVTRLDKQAPPDDDTSVTADEGRSS